MNLRKLRRSITRISGAVANDRGNRTGLAYVVLASAHRVRRDHFVDRDSVLALATAKLATAGGIVAENSGIGDAAEYLARSDAIESTAAIAK